MNPTLPRAVMTYRKLAVCFTKDGAMSFGTNGAAAATISAAWAGFLFAYELGRVIRQNKTGRFSSIWFGVGSHA